MVNENVNLNLNGDASGYVNATKQAAAASKELAAQQREMERTAKKAAAEAEKLAAKEAKAAEEAGKLSTKLELLNKTNSAAGASFGGITGPLSDFGDLTEKVGLKNAAMMTGVGAAAMALMALGSAFISAGQAAVASVRSFEDTAAKLGEYDSVVKANEGSIRSANLALEAYDTAAMRFGVTLTGAVAPAIETMGYALSSIINYLTESESVTTIFNGAITALGVQMALAFPPLVPIVYALGEGLQALADDGRAAEEELLAAAAAADALAASMAVAKSTRDADYAKESKAQMQALGMMESEKEMSARIAAEAKAESERKSAAAKALADRKAAADKAEAEATRKAEEQAKKLLALEEKRAAAFEKSYKFIAEKNLEEAKQQKQMAIWNAQTQEDKDAQQGVQTFHDTIGFEFQPSQVAYDPMNDVVDQTKKTAAEWSSTWQNEILAVGGYLGGFADLAAQIGSRVIAQTEEDTKKAKKKQFAIEKASAIAQATINTFLGISAALTTPGPAGVVLAVLAGITGAAQVALIAATPPPAYHVGGLLPDEVNQGAYKSRENERTAVFTQQAIRNMGGEDTIKRMNAGDKPSQVNNYFVIDGQPRLARAFAGPTPDYGIRTRR